MPVNPQNKLFFVLFSVDFRSRPGYYTSSTREYEMFRAITIVIGWMLIIIAAGVVFSTCNDGKLKALYGQLAATGLFTFGLALLANGV
jgi:hypothetical protein